MPSKLKCSSDLIVASPQEMTFLHVQYSRDHQGTSLKYCSLISVRVGSQGW